MPRTPNRDEIEIKLHIENLSALRTLLKRLRAREITPRTYESNTLFDTPRQDLRRRGQLIRIRIERPSSSVGKRRSIASIDRGARIMGFNRRDYSKESYGSLYLAACRRRGQKPGNMLFPPTKK